MPEKTKPADNPIMYWSVKIGSIEDPGTAVTRLTNSTLTTHKQLWIFKRCECHRRIWRFT